MRALRRALPLLQTGWFKNLPLRQKVSHGAVCEDGFTGLSELILPLVLVPVIAGPGLEPLGQHTGGVAV